MGNFLCRLVTGDTVNETGGLQDVLGAVYQTGVLSSFGFCFISYSPFIYIMQNKEVFPMACLTGGFQVAF